MRILSHKVFKQSANGFQGIMESKNNALDNQSYFDQSGELQADITAKLESEAEEAADLSNFDSI